MRNRIENKKKYFAIYTITYAIVMLCTFIPFIIKGRSLVNYGDGFNSFFPSFVYVGKYIRELINCLSIKQFDFSIGLGEGVIPIMKYMGFGNIFSLISALGTNSIFLYTVMQALQIYMCGLTFSIYSLSHKKPFINTLVGAITYSFSMYVLVQGIHFYPFIYPAITLPLLFLGIDQILERRTERLSILFTIIVFAQGLTGFYFLYMETIMISVYYVISYLCLYKGFRIKEFMKDTFYAGVQYLIGILLSGVVLIPTVIAFFNSSRAETGSISFAELLLYKNQKIYYDYLKNFVIPNGYEDGLGISVIGILAVVTLIYMKSYEKKTKICVIISLVSVFIPAVGFIMNGFSYSVNRWIFVLYFFVSYSIVVSMDRIMDVDVKWIRYALCFIGITLIAQLCDFSSGISIIERILKVLYYVVISGTIIAPLFIKKISRKRIVLLIALFSIGNVCLNGLMINGPRKLGCSGFSANFILTDELMGKYTNSLANGLQNEEQFYRLDICDSGLDASNILDYCGTSAYYSVMNGNVSEFYRELCITPGYRGSYSLSGFDGREILETLFSVKYYEDYRKDNTQYIRIVNENNSILPLGYVYDEVISRSDFDQLTPLEKMETLVQKIVLEDDGVLSEYQGRTIDYNSKEIPYEIEYSDIEVKDHQFTVNDDSVIRIKTKEMQDDGELYVNIRNLKRPSAYTEMYLNGKQALYQMGDTPEDIWVKVPHDDRNEINIYFKGNGNYSLDFIRMYWYSDQNLDQQITKLQENSLTNIKIENDRVTGDVELDEGGFLFLSIPYSSGWTAIVDHEKVEIEKANIAFCAIPIPKGSHSIELCYVTPGLLAGKICLILGAGVCLLFYAYRKSKLYKR